MIKNTLLAGMLLLPMLAISKTDSLVSHQQKLKKLERDIVQLHQRLEQSKNKRSLLTHELARIEKQIGQNSQRFTKVIEKQTKRQQQLRDVEHQLNRLKTQLEQQQSQLARHVQLR